MKAAIFDHDGVLVDSEPLHRIAWKRTFGPRGIVVSKKDYAWSIGRRDLTFAGVIIKKFALGDSAESLVAEKRSHLLRLLATRGQTFEGVLELVERLGGAYRLGIASSAMRPEIDISIGHFSLEGLFAAIVSNEDVASHKPHPEPFLLCADRLGVAPHDCVVFEDSVTGIESAKAAGMKVIAFASTFPPEDLAGADAVISSFADTDAVLHLVESIAPSAGQAKLYP